MSVCKCGSGRRHLLLNDDEQVVGFECPECGAEWHRTPPAPRDLVSTDVLEQTDD